MSPFRYYIPPVYLRLFDVKADTTIFDLWSKRNDLFGGDSDEHFKETNPKTHVEIMSAWSLLTDPEMRPFQILGASKNIYFEDLNQLYCKLISRFPLLQFPECNHKVSKAYLILSNPENRLLNDFFIFDDSVWELYLLECEDEIAVRRTIEREFSGSISKQIINSTLFCYLKACQIEETKGDWELARSYWEKAYLGWQGIFQEAFIWEEMRSRVLSSKIFSPIHAQNFNEESLERIKQKLREILILNTLESARRACGYDVRATPHHLKFLKYFSLKQESYRSEAARIYNQCAYLLSLDNRLEEARSLLEEALILDPHLTEIKTNLELAKTATSGMGQALRLLYQNKERDAFDLLKNILNENPQDNDAKELFITLLYKLSHDSSRVGDYNEAYLFLSEASKFRNDYKNELGLVLKAKQKNLIAQVIQYLQNEEYEQVIRILMDYIKKYPDQNPPRALLARILNRMAMIKDRQRLWLEARELLREAVNIEPDNEVLKTNLERVDQAAENQQIANDLANAAKLIEEGNAKEAINHLQPVYTEQNLPGPIMEEMRLLLASAYFQQGQAMKKEAENATSRGAIREAFYSAHKYMTISCFLNNSEETRGHIVQLEETIPDLVDELYDPSIFPQPPGGKRRPFVQKKYYRMWRKFRIRMRLFLEFIPKILSTPVLIPVTLLPIFGLCFLIVKTQGCGILSALVLALLIQAALSAFFISKIKPEKEKLLVGLSIVCIFLIFGDYLWIYMYQQKMPDFRALFNRLYPNTDTQSTPIPAPTPTPEKTGESFVTETPVPTQENPESITPLITSVPEVTPETTPEKTPEQTPIPKTTPSLLGKNIDISFTIQELGGIRQNPTPAFVYRIMTKDGMATLIMDPLVYIKIPKSNLEPGVKIQAKVKVLSESDMSVYMIESPKEFRLD